MLLAVLILVMSNFRLLFLNLFTVVFLFFYPAKESMMTEEFRFDRRCSVGCRCSNAECPNHRFVCRNEREFSARAKTPDYRVGSQGKRKCKLCSSAFEYEVSYSLSELEHAIHCWSCESRHAVIEVRPMNLRNTQQISLNELNLQFASTTEDHVFNCVDCGAKNKIVKEGAEYKTVVPSAPK